MAYWGVVILGLVIGSFLNVLICRLPQKKSIVVPASHCPACSYPLKAIDLIPLFSYLILKGRCRYCKEAISLRYPAIEALTALLFLLVFMKWGFSPATLGGWLLNILLISAAFIDGDHGVIPDKITYPAIVAGLISALFTIGLKSSLGGLAFFGGFLFLLALISGGGMGGGDIKLAAAIGAFTGFNGAVVAFIIASLLGGLYAVVLLLSRKAGRKTMVKFGPFLAAAAFLSYNYAYEIASFYLGFFI